MILGRNTQQWMALITATLGFVQLMIGVLMPELAATSAVILGGLGGLLGVYIAFIANTLTTPIEDARGLEVGQKVNEGTAIVARVADLKPGSASRLLLDQEPTG